MPIIAGWAETNSGTVLTIPPNTSWIGCVNLSIRSATTAAMPFIDLVDAGGNVQPPAGSKILSVGISTQISAGQAVAPGIFIETGATSATLRLNFAGATAALGIANGYGS